MLDERVTTSGVQGVFFLHWKIEGGRGGGERKTEVTYCYTKIRADCGELLQIWWQHVCLLGRCGRGGLVDLAD